MDHELIDACSEYIESKNAHYLAKEGYAVYYHSPTERKSDYAWHRLTPTEMLRTIKALRLPVNMSVALKPHHLVAAFQELGRVYEYGVKSRHKVTEEVFNYLEHAKVSLGDELMCSLATELFSRGYKGLILVEVQGIFREMQEKLELNVKSPEARDLLCKHFELLGYEIKSGSKRPMVEGRKTPTLMLSGAMPRDVVSVEGVKKTIITKIHGELM